MRWTFNALWAAALVGCNGSVSGGDVVGDSIRDLGDPLASGDPVAGDLVAGDPVGGDSAEPTWLVFVHQPTPTLAGSVITPPVRVEIQDGVGRIVARTDTISVAFSPFGDPSGGAATLSGTVDIAAIDGVAVFSDLAIDTAGDDFILRASGGTHSAVDSAPIDVFASKPTFRSVGPQNESALAVGTGNPMDISDRTATFTAALPDHVGIGDVIQYDSDGALAFISGRAAGDVFQVATSAGGMPAPVAADESWTVYRAYRSLAGATHTRDRRNRNIAIAFDDDGNWSDLVARDETRNIACYADGEQESGDWANLDWNTGPQNVARVFTPVHVNEVGVPQRHDGTLSGYVRRDAVVVTSSYVHIDGLAGDGTAGDRIFGINVDTAPGRVVWSNSLAVRSSNGSRAFDVMSNPAGVVVELWNNIATTYADHHAFLLGGQGTIYAYNNTAISVDGSGFHVTAGTSHLKNNLAHTTGTGTGFSGSFSSLDYCAASDDSIAGGHNRPDQVFAFVGVADFHLATSDVGATDHGTDASAELGYTTDIDGARRVGTWDIGADER